MVEQSGRAKISGDAKADRNREISALNGCTCVTYVTQVRAQTSRNRGQEATKLNSAERARPRQMLGIWLEIFYFEPDLGLKLGQTKPNISGTVPTNRHTTIPNDSGQISACLDYDQQLFKLRVSRVKDRSLNQGIQPIMQAARRYENTPDVCRWN